MHSSLLFLRSFLRHPIAVSSVVPTSSFGIRRVLRKIQAGRRVIVEYGPGTGGTAAALLASGKLTGDSKVILIEKTKVLAEELGRTFAEDNRVSIFHESALNVRDILEECGEKTADYVLSSIPFSVMTKQERRRIIQTTHDILKEDGSFIVYLFRHRVKGYLEEVFPHVETGWEWRNVPPLFIFEARKYERIVHP